MVRGVCKAAFGAEDPHGLKNSRASEISYKPNAAVDGAMEFASRSVTNFSSCTRGFCITVAGRLSF
jgi:hypothetical protein